MSLKVEKLSQNMAKLTIEVPAEELEQAIEKAYQKNKDKISIPGFRKGKVPRPMIEKMYGKNIFYENAADELIPAAYDKALDECTEDIVSAPKIEVVSIEAGQPLIFTAEVALKPEVKLGQYKGIEIEAVDNTVTEEELEAAINKEREANARNIAVEDRPVQTGDMTIIDFEGFVDGVAFEGGKGTDYPLTIGSGSFIPGFEEQLVGAVIDEETDVNVTFPENYQAEELAGQAAVFKCTVKEIKEKELPEVDDEFAGEVSEFDTLAEYKADLREKLSKDKEKAGQEAKEDAVIEAIIAGAEMEIPAPMLETQQKQMADEFAQRIRMQGLTIEQYFQFTGGNYEQMVEQIAPQAKKRIESRLVLEAIAAAEQITVSDAEYEAEIIRMAEAYKMEAEQIKERMGGQGEKQIKTDLAVQKAVELVTAQAVEV